MKYMKRTTIPARTPPGLTRSMLLLIAQGGSVKLAMGWERGVKGGLVSLRIGSVNVTSMKKRDGEVVDLAARRRLDFCCLQETEWKGEGARKLGEYKFFWMSCSKGIHGVGLLVADRWIEKVLEPINQSISTRAVASYEATEAMALVVFTQKIIFLLVVSVLVY